MELLHGIIYGMIAGFAEFFPASALAHEKFFVLFSGVQVNPLLRTSAVLGCLMAVLFLFHKQLRHIQREMRIASTKKHRRLRQPDMSAVADGKMIWTTVLPVLAGLLLQRYVPDLFSQLWFMALVFMLNGAMLYAMQFMSGGTRNSRSLSRMDGYLYGLCGAFAVIPGLSRVTNILFVGHLRKCDRSYITDMTVLLAIPWLIGMLIFHLIPMIAALGSLTFLSWIGAILGAAAAFAAACGAISLMRYFAVRIGFQVFAFYSWAIGFISFILYLMI